MTERPLRVLIEASPDFTPSPRLRAAVAELRATLEDEYGAADDVDGFVMSPRDPASGLPTGKRTHRPFLVGDWGIQAAIMDF
jgi:hypothetical protein